MNRSIRAGSVALRFTAALIWSRIGRASAFVSG